MGGFQCRHEAFQLIQLVESFQCLLIRYGSVLDTSQIVK